MAWNDLKPTNVNAMRILRAKISYNFLIYNKHYRLLDFWIFFKLHCIYMLLARPVARLLNISVFVLSMSFREHFRSYFFKRDYYFFPLLHKNHAQFFFIYIKMLFGCCDYWYIGWNKNVPDQLLAVKSGCPSWKLGISFW